MAAKGKRRWLRQERNKNDFNNDLPALIFVSGTIQALFSASPMVPINGEHSPRVGVMFRPIVTSIFDVTIGGNLTTTCGLGPPMIKAIGGTLNNACRVPETKIRAGKSLLKSFLFLSCLSYLLLPSAATPFHLQPY